LAKKTRVIRRHSCV